MSQRRGHVRIVDAKKPASITSTEDRSDVDSDGYTYESSSSESSDTRSRAARGFSPRRPRPYPPPLKGKRSSTYYRYTIPTMRKYDKRDSVNGAARRRSATHRESQRPKTANAYEDLRMRSPGDNMSYYSRSSCNGLPLPTYSTSPHPYFGGFGGNCMPPYTSYGPQPLALPFPPMTSIGGHLPTHFSPLQHSHPLFPLPSITNMASQRQAASINGHEDISVAHGSTERAPRDVSMEIRRLKQELEQRQQELLAIGQTDELKDDNDRIRRDLEESFKLKMSVMQKAEEDARKEMERVKAEAELAARKAVEDERITNAERQKMYQETLEQVKREAREELEKHLRLEKERKEREDAHRAKEAEQKLAADAEARRKFQEEEEEKKEKLLRELREEIHAEIKAEKSKSLGSRKTSCRGLSSSRRPSRSETASNVDPFEFFEGYATPYETHTEPSSFEEPVWSRDELAALWSHQARGGHAERKEDPTHSRTNPFGANGIPYDEERVVNGLPAGETSTFLGTQDPQHRPGLRSGFPFAATDGDGEDSDKITVIPAATYRNNMESISGAEPSLEASLAGLDITNTDTTAAVQEPNLAPRHQPVHDRRSSQRINNWPRTPCRGQSSNERAAGGDNSRRKLPHDAPDTDGGVNLQHFETLRPAPSRSESRLSSGANTKGTGLHQASPARSQATRDSPLLPYLAKHLSDFEENASVSLGRLPERSQQPRLMGSKRPEDSFRSDEDTLQGSAARYGDWPPPVGQQFKWPGPASGGVDVQPGQPVAFVPCVMVPLHMLQLPVQGPVLYSGMMMARQT